MGTYISSDPIGLNGNNPTLYGYVKDTNAWLDVFGLAMDTPLPGRPSPDNTGGLFVPGKGSGHYKSYADFGGKKGWIDKYGNLWVPTGDGNLAHGGSHWDVQKKGGGGYANVYPGGKQRGGWKNFPKNCK